MRTLGRTIALLTIVFLVSTTAATAAQDWTQLKYDCRHSGNVADRIVSDSLGLVGAIPLTDAILTAPVVSDGRVYAVDASGTAFCIDISSLRILWKFDGNASKTNCNNVSSPAIAGNYLHFGTMAGSYFVLDKTDGKVVKEIKCGEPVFSSPVVANGRVYFATLGSRVYALEPDGTVCWTWDFVKEVLGFTGDRWSGEQWLKFKGDRVTWKDQFCCSVDMVANGKMLVVPAGGSAVCLQDKGSSAVVAKMAEIPAYAGSEKPCTFALSIGEDGSLYRQWHRRDNTGRVEIIPLLGNDAKTTFVPGTLTEINRPGSLSFCSVSIRGKDVYRCRPEEGFGFCRHSPDNEQAQYLGGYPSIASPILLRDTGVYGGLDGRLYIVPLSGKGKVRSFKTAFGSPISAPAAVCDGRIYFGCEDGYLYILGPDGTAPLPSRNLQLQQVRSPLASRLADSKYDWFTNFGNQSCTNSNDQGLKSPFKVKWIRRYNTCPSAAEAVCTHIPPKDRFSPSSRKPEGCCGGGTGRAYMHLSRDRFISMSVCWFPRRDLKNHMYVVLMQAQVRCSGKPPSPAHQAGAGSNRPQSVKTWPYMLSGRENMHHRERKRLMSTKVNR